MSQDLVIPQGLNCYFKNKMKYEKLWLSKCIDFTLAAKEHTYVACCSD